MKKLLISLFALTATQFGSQAQANSSADERLERVQEIAKEIRQDHWRSGYEDVNSHIEVLSKDRLDNYVKKESNSEYESPLNSDEIADLYRCYHSTHCALFLIGVSSSYYGGYGQESHFILMSKKSMTYREIRHTVYSE